jgi:hypothetical protein
VSRVPRVCPYCGADDVLPFESEETHESDPSFFIVLITAVVLIGGYFLFVVSSYIYFPVAIFIFTIISAKLVKRGEEQRKKETSVERDYMCIECGRSFRAKGG